MTKSKNRIVDVVVASDLYEAGRTEDGEQYTAELYYVLVEFENGARLRHKTSFPGCEAICSPDEEDYGMVFFKDIRAEASTKAERLADRVLLALEQGRSLDYTYWHEADPVYGSRVYLDKVAEMTPEQRAE